MNGVDERVEALRAAGRRVEDPQLVSLLEESLGDTDPAVREAAVRAIHDRIQPGSYSIEPLACARGFTSFESPAIAKLADAAVGRLRDPEPRVRVATVLLLRGRDVIAHEARNACNRRIDGPPDPSEALLSPATADRFRALQADPDPDVRDAVAEALVDLGPLDGGLVDLTMRALENTDGQTGCELSGITRMGSDVSVARLLVERLAAASLPARVRAAEVVVRWPEGAELTELLQSWASLEPDTKLREHVQELVSSRRERQAFLEANAVALSRVRELEVSVREVFGDASPVVARIRQAIEDPAPLVREAALRAIGSLTLAGGFDFNDADHATGPPNVMSSVEEFSGEIEQLQDDSDPRVQALALELSVNVDLIRQQRAMGIDPNEEEPSQMPTLSGAMAGRLATLSRDAESLVRTVAVRALLRWAPLDHDHLRRVLDGLAGTNADVVSEAVSGIVRLRRQSSLLPSLVVQLRQLAPSAQREAFPGLAAVPLDEPLRRTLEAWLGAEGDTIIGRDIRAILEAQRTH